MGGALIYLYVAYAIGFLLVGGLVVYVVMQMRSVRSELRELRRHRDS
ncbi:MAG: heme exporter protein CcmD [Candidatus Dormibacterales bacterium]